MHLTVKFECWHFYVLATVFGFLFDFLIFFCDWSQLSNENEKMKEKILLFREIYDMSD